MAVLEEGNFAKKRYDRQLRIWGEHGQGGAHSTLKRFRMTTSQVFNNSRHAL
jgi:hypothetical protein